MNLTLKKDNFCLVVNKVSYILYFQYYFPLTNNCECNLEKLFEFYLLTKNCFIILNILQILHKITEKPFTKYSILIIFSYQNCLLKKLIFLTHNYLTQEITSIFYPWKE